MSGTGILPILLAQATQPSGLVNRLRIGETFHHTRASGWLLLLAGIFGGLLAGKVVQMILRSVADAADKRGWRLQAVLFRSGGAPAALFMLTIGIWMGLGAIYIERGSELETFVQRAMWFLAIIALAWFLYNLVDMIDLLLTQLTARTESKLDDQVVPLVRKTLRIFLVIVFVLFTADNVFGADIGAWLAGLGIAGLAVSLAAQDSLKNLFGSITILMDRPFQVGDRVVIDGHDGPVEEIGFRSTKLRKGSGELVTIPNSKVVDASVVNVSVRPNIPRTVTLGIAYDTPPAKVARAVEILKEILAEPEIAAGFSDKTPPRAFFEDFGGSALNLKVQYWYTPASDWWAYVDHAQRFNLKVLEAFEREGIEIAFPTQTLFLAEDPRRRFGGSQNETNGQR